MAFFIQNVNSGKYLDVKDNDENPGAQVILFEYTGGENQQWEFKKGRIHSKLNGLVMDLKDDAETGPVVMWPDNGGDNQK
ncbi:clotting factor G alpha subunit-like [Periplaneta americana]|uniref:clotting factor G alpha subunit-like n=1 Tax=Periplaneta americana TaxID=6978 RepID=UPI0037E984FB